MAIESGAALSRYLIPLKKAERVFVAFSGGLDSTVLLHMTAATISSKKITAVHVNHGLSPRSNYWQQHCAEVSSSLGVGFETFDVSVDGRKQGPEQAARSARYAVFEKLLAASDILLMAHHLDDQVETVVYRMLRGSGPRGLSGIPQSRSLGKGTLLRPFLNVIRSDLENYAAQNRLSWIEDESNQLTDFDRNYLRHEMLPVVARRWPDYRQRLLRTSAQCDSAAKALRELARMDLETTREQPEIDGYSLCLEQFAALSVSRQKNLLLEWISYRGLGQTGHKICDEVVVSLVPARQDSVPKITWHGGEFRRFNNRLYLLAPQPHRPDREETVLFTVDPGGEPVPLPDGTTLRASRSRGGGALAARPGDGLSVRYRTGGERCRPAFRQGSRPLKKLLAEYNVEPWLRYRIPLIYINGELAAVAGLFVCEPFCCREGEEGVSLHWQFPNRQNFSDIN